MARILDSVRPKALAAAQGWAEPLMMQAFHVANGELEPADIAPDWVVEGAPKARAKHLFVAPDKHLSIALWDCTEGKFNWYFAGDEFVHILEGEVTVRDGDGSERRLRPGDVAYFPAGMRSLWHVHGYVKKVAMFRQNRPTLVARARRKLAALVKSAAEARP
jgi:uncharacterized cupin superfamily protein